MYLPALREHNLASTALCSYSSAGYESSGDSSKGRPCAVVTLPLKQQACRAALPCLCSGMDPAQWQKMGAGSPKDIRHCDVLGPSSSSPSAGSAAFPGQGKGGVRLLPTGRLDPDRRRLSMTILWSQCDVWVSLSLPKKVNKYWTHLPPRVALDHECEAIQEGFLLSYTYGTSLQFVQGLPSRTSSADLCPGVFQLLS